MKEFSVITSVYKGDDPSYVNVAIDSIAALDDCRPSEIILVVDGPVGNELESALKRCTDMYGKILKVIRLKENKGLGNALKVGVENASYDLIARMDSDDISVKNRFRLQLAYFEKHPEVDVVGGQMTEFIGMPSNVVAKREVPLTNEDIYRYMRSRCGLNHVTVMFKKDAIIKAGNYQDWFWNEDYYLWVRLMIQKCVFANLPEVLVNVRSGNDQYKRRGGKRYFESEKGIQKLMLKHHLISFPRFVFNVAIRWMVQVAMPNNLRGLLFRSLFRK